MQHCKAFFKIAKRNILTISVYFVIYVILLIIMAGNGEDQINEAFQSKKLDIGVIDEDRSEASKALEDYLGSIHNVVEMENDPEVLQDQLYYRNLKYVLTIPKGFEEKFLNGEKDHILENAKITASASGYFLDEQIDQYLSGVSLYMSVGNTFKEASEKIRKEITEAENIENIVPMTDEGAASQKLFYMYRYLPYIYIAILICGLAPILVIFNKKDIYNRIECSSTSILSRNLQLTISCIVYSLLIWGAFILVALVLHGEKVFTEYSLLGIVNCLVFIIFAAGLAFLISSFAPDDGVVNLLANIVGLSMSFTCGVFVPMNMLSDTVLAVAKFLPAYWFTRCNNMLGGLASENFDMSLFWKALLVQLLFAVIMFVAAMVVRRFRKQKA